MRASPGLPSTVPVMARRQLCRSKNLIPFPPRYGCAIDPLPLEVVPEGMTSEPATEAPSRDNADSATLVRQGQRLVTCNRRSAARPEDTQYCLLLSPPPDRANLPQWDTSR